MDKFVVCQIRNLTLICLFKQEQNRITVKQLTNVQLKIVQIEFKYKKYTKYIHKNLYNSTYIIYIVGEIQLNLCAIVEYDE